MEEVTEVLGEVRILYDFEALVLIKLTALIDRKHACIIHPQKLKPLLVTNLVLRRAYFCLQFKLNVRTPEHHTNLL